MKQISLFWFLGYCKILFVMICFLITYEVCSTRKFYLKILYNIFLRKNHHFQICWCPGQVVKGLVCHAIIFKTLIIYLFTYFIYFISTNQIQAK